MKLEVSVVVVVGGGGGSRGGGSGNVGEGSGGGMPEEWSGMVKFIVEMLVWEL